MDEGKHWPQPTSKKQSIYTRVESRCRRNSLWLIISIPLLMVMAFLMFIVIEFLPYHFETQKISCQNIGGLLLMFCIFNSYLGFIVISAFSFTLTVLICILAFIGSRIAVTKVGYYIFLSSAPVTVVLSLITLLQLYNTRQ